MSKANSRKTLFFCISNAIGLTLCAFAMGGAAQARTSFKPIRAKANGTVTVRDYLRRGGKVDLAWATTSQMACWPSIRNEHFNGNHVFFTVDLPRRSVVTIEAVPNSRDLDIGLYAYSVGKTSRPPLPPKVHRAVSCEESHLKGINRQSVTANPGGAESVRLNAILNPYTVVIGVAGSRGAVKGSFTLKVTLKTGGPTVKDTGPPPIEAVKSKPNGTVEVAGKIDGGKLIPQRFASLSSMACWPTPQDQHFSGHHVLFNTDIPRRSEMFIELIPSRKDLDLSLYAYTTSTTGQLRLPPRITSAVSCEASYLYGIKRRSITTNPGGVEKVRLNAVLNPYRVVIGVAGAHGAKKGDFKLRIRLKTAGPGIKDTGPPPIEKVESKPNGTVEVAGRIDGGKVIPQRWASYSSMACWPTPQNVHFSGHHVLFNTDLPRRSEMFIELIPARKDLDLSLYAYTTSTTGALRLPPRITSAVSCEASYLYGIKRRSITSNPGGVEKVRLNAIRNPYRVVIGVAGANGAKAGDFKLRIRLKTAKPGVADTGPPPIENVASKPNETVEVAGKIDGGKVIPQRWASYSSMACWTTVQNQHFSGNHVLYSTDLPARSEMFIELVPARKDLDLSLYAYTTGTTGALSLPPRVSRSVSCEASYLYGIKRRSITSNPGGIEKVRVNAIRNPYRVVIGVAGANGVKKGDFKLRIRLKTAGPGVKDTGPPPIEKVSAKPNGSVEVTGSIDGGKVIPQRWASYSSMACWPTPQNVHFSGNHVLFSTEIPRRSQMEIEVVPDQKDLDLSLYAYMTGTRGRLDLPPRVTRAITCEAAYLSGVKRRSITTNPGGSETVRLNTVRYPYRVVIGVAGAHGAKKGSFKLKIRLKTAAAPVRDTGPPPIEKISAKPNGSVEVTGSIDGGKVIPQRWASYSSMACWPTPQNVHFSGKHVLYSTEIGRRSEMTIELIPASKDLDLSLYAYTTSTRGRLSVPPRVYRSVSCEASYLAGVKSRSVTSNPGGTEKVKLNAVRYPYRVVIGVAGAHGAKEGAFKLRVTTRGGGK